MMGLDHVNYFSKDTIKRILATHGYEVLSIKSSFELKLFIMYTIMPFIKKLKGENKKQTLLETNYTITAGERQQYFNKFTQRPKWQLKLFVFILLLLICNSIPMFCTSAGKLVVTPVKPV